MMRNLKNHDAKRSSVKVYIHHLPGGGGGEGCLPPVILLSKHLVEEGLSASLLFLGSPGSNSTKDEM
jgi:hypothetical protein